MKERLPSLLIYRQNQEIAAVPRKHRLVFREVSSPITDFVTKFGGQPTWLSNPQWPLSRETRNPMRFICQIKLAKALFPDTTAQMAYVFMTDEEDGELVDGTYEPNGGENAVVLQPGATDIPTRTIAEGPTLYRMVVSPGHELLQPEACEFAISVIEEDDITFLPEIERWKLPDASNEAAAKFENKIGGTPVFMQSDEFPFDGKCQLLLQLDSCTVPFYINFGDAGVGYAFMNELGDQAKFLWQCG